MDIRQFLPSEKVIKAKNEKINEKKYAISSFPASNYFKNKNKKYIFNLIYFNI